MEGVITRHGVPAQILSDRGKAFLFWTFEVLMGYHKLNTTAFHPQTDGLVEQYRTLTSMLAKTTKKGGPEWDKQLPYALFATELASKPLENHLFTCCMVVILGCLFLLSPQESRITTYLNEYGIELHEKLAAAWELARKNIGQAQKRQKSFYDKQSTATPFRPGERVFLYKPAEKTGEARKLARPFHGPYRIMSMDSNTARIDRPEEEPLLVALARLRRCPDELGSQFWPADKRRKKTAESGEVRSIKVSLRVTPELTNDSMSGSQTDLPGPTADLDTANKSTSVPCHPRKGGNQEQDSRARIWPDTTDVASQQGCPADTTSQLPANQEAVYRGMENESIKIVKGALLSTQAGSLHYSHFTTSLDEF